MEGATDGGMALLLQIGGGLILLLAIGWLVWRSRRPSAGLPATTHGTPARPPSKPNGEDRRP